MLEQEELTRKYLEEVYRCEKVINLLTPENFPRVVSICRDEMEKLREVEALFSDGRKHSTFAEVFSINRQALELLLEYSDIFQLYDFEMYKEHCLALLDNFKNLLEDKKKLYRTKIVPFNTISRKHISLSQNHLR